MEVKKRWFKHRYSVCNHKRPNTDDGLHTFLGRLSIVLVFKTCQIDQLSERQSNPDVFSPVALFALKLCQFFGMPLCSRRQSQDSVLAQTQTHTQKVILSLSFWLRPGAVAPHTVAALPMWHKNTVAYTKMSWPAYKDFKIRKMLNRNHWNWKRHESVWFWLAL